MQNVLEEEVRTIYAELRGTHGAGKCDCEQCQDDVISLVLNHARPRYVVTARRSLGAAVTRVALSQESARAELTVLILDAMSKVAKNPLHER